MTNKPTVKLSGVGKPFIFQFRNIAFAKSHFLEAVSGYRKAFWLIWRREPEEYRKGWNDARAYVEQTIAAMEQSGVGISYKDKWQQGYRDAVTVFKRELPSKR